MPRLSNNSVSVRERPPTYQRDQVDNEAAPASNGTRMRQRGRQSETRGLTLGSVLSAGETRSQARSAADSRTRLRSASSVQRNKGDVRFSMALPFTSEPLEGKIDMALGPRCDSDHRASKKSLSSVRLHCGLVLSPMVAAPTPLGSSTIQLNPHSPDEKSDNGARG
jgi:hypothetical protein